MGTIIVATALAAVVIFIIYRLVQNHKKGKSCCGCSCGCSCSASCNHTCPSCSSTFTPPTQQGNNN